MKYSQMAGWLFQTAAGRRVSFLVLVALTLLIYGQSLSVPFLFDDFRIIERNPAIRDLSGMLSLKSLSSRPLVDLTLALNYAAGKLEPAGYHILNILFHLMNGGIAWLVAAALTRAWYRRQHTAVPTSARVIPFTVAAIFLLHPVQTQPVIYICQRYTLVAAGFYMLSIYCFIQARMRSQEKWEPSSLTHPLPLLRCVLWYAGMMAAALLGVLSKQNTASLPFMLFFIELLVFNRTWWGLVIRVLLLVAGIAGVVLVFWAMRNDQIDSVKALIHFLDVRTREIQGVSRIRYLLTQWQVVWEYLRMVVWPTGLTIEHAYRLTSGNLDLLTILAGAGHLAMLVLAWAVRKKHGLVSLGICWFYIALSVESSIIPIRDPMVDHRLYLPMAGVALIAGYLAQVCFQKTEQPKVAAGMLAALILIATGWSYTQAQVWKSSESVWRDSLEKNPQNPKAYTNLGRVYELKGDRATATAYYTKAMEMDASLYRPALNLGLMYAREGAYDTARDYLEQVIRIHPVCEKAYGTLGLIHLMEGRRDKALQLLKHADRLNPKNPVNLFNLGLLHIEMEKLNPAFTYFSRLVRLFPEEQPAAYYYMGYIREQAGAADDAAKWRAMAIRYGVDVKELNLRFVMRIDADG